MYIYIHVHIDIYFKLKSNVFGHFSLFSVDFRFVRLLAGPPWNNLQRFKCCA